MGFNRSPYVFRPQFYTMVDSWRTFTPSVWYDPAIVKFVRTADAALLASMPNAYYTAWGRTLEPSAFFVGPRVPQSFQGDRFGAVSMIAALSLLARLGARRVTLVGAGFWMTPQRCYCVPTSPRTGPQIQAANRLFKQIEASLGRLAALWQANDFRLQNATAMTRLSRDVAPYVPLGEAVDEALADFPDPSVEWAYLNTEVADGLDQDETPEGIAR